MPTKLFEKGKSGNPSGRPKLPDHIKKFKNMSYADFLNKLREFSALTREQMKTMIQDPSITMFDLMFANIVASAAKGDRDSRNIIIDRMWGKVPEVSHVKNLDAALDDIPEENVIEYLRKTNT